MPTPTSELTGVVVAPNPGPMTLEGTNTYALAAPGSSGVVLVDPGPDDASHVDRLSRIGPIELVLITHRHADHTAAVPSLVERTGASVRAADPAHCHAAAPLISGETFEAAGVRIRVVATPGHSADSVSFHLPDDGPYGSVLTGDTILGRGTTILSEPDGALGPYLQSLWALRVLGPATVLPGHGPPLTDLVEACDAYLDSRTAGLRQLTDQLSQLELNEFAADSDGVDETTVRLVTKALYRALHPRARTAAETMVRKQLDYLHQSAPV